MTNDTTSPPLPPAFVPPAGGAEGAIGLRPPAPRRGLSAVGIIMLALGAILLVGVLVSSALSSLAAASARSDAVHSADASGATGIDVEVGATTVAVGFGDVSEATLEVTGSLRADQWHLDRRDDVLVVRSPAGWFAGFGWMGADTERATLTLPERLRGVDLDADLALGAGAMRVDAGFGDLTVEVGAGRLEIAGSARSLVSEVNSGYAEIELEGVERAELRVNVGGSSVELRGDPPREVTVEVSAGSIDLTVPDATYAVTADVAAGNVNNRLDTGASSRHLIDVSVAAGSVTLSSAR